jgi:hypothetical protein
MSDVEEYVTKHNLADILPLVRKGALVAQNPGGFETISELDENDRTHLRNELLHRWRQPRLLYFTIIMNSIAAAIQGWDQTGSNAANLGFPLELGINDDPTLGDCSPNCARNTWIIGFVNSAPYIAVALL